MARMVLGTRLRRLREAQYVSRLEAAEAIRATDAHVRAVERGFTSCRLRDVADMLTIYGVHDVSERALLLDLAEQADAPGWWVAYADVVPDWFETYLGIEQVASVIRVFEPHVVPDLLQTPAYARALVSSGHAGAGAPPAGAERRVELRMRRQEILHAPSPPHLWVVIDEAVLHRPVGGPDTLQAQLRHLVDLCRLPHVTVQLLPFRAAAQVVAGGPVALLRLAERGLPDIVCLEQLCSALYPEDHEETQFYRQLVDRLVTLARPASDTPTVLLRLLHEGFPATSRI